MKKLPKNKIKIIFYIVVLILLLLVTIILVQSGYRNDWRTSLKILNNASQENTFYKRIVDTYQGYSISIPTDWNVFIANPEVVEKRLTEYKKSSIKTPEQLYGYNDPGYTTENVIRSVNTVFQKGTTTQYLSGAYETPFIHLNKSEDIKSMIEFDSDIKSNFVDYQNRLNSKNEVVLLKSNIKDDVSTWIIKARYSNNPNIAYHGYVKKDGVVMNLIGYHMKYDEFERVVLSLKFI